MERVSARELKNRTGEVLQRVRRGERIAVTHRGRPVALLLPVEDPASVDEATSSDPAWEDVMEALKRTKPAFPSWREAMSRTRRRRAAP